MSIQISGPCTPTDGSITAAKIGSENAGDGQVLTADGNGGAAWEAPDWLNFPRIVSTEDVSVGANPAPAWLTAAFYAEAGRNPIPGDKLIFRYSDSETPPNIVGEKYSVFIRLNNTWATPILLGEI